MVQIYINLHYTFNEISNDTSHTQIRVKTKKLWPRQVGKRKLYRDKVLCRDRENSVATEKLCRDKNAGKKTKTNAKNGYFGFFSSPFHPKTINTPFF